MLLHQDRPACQRQDIVVREDEAFPVLAGDGDAPRLPRATFFVDQLELLRAELLLENRAESLCERGLEHIELVWLDRALHHALTESVGAVHEDGVGAAAHGHVAVRAVLSFETVIGVGDALDERFRQAGCEDSGPYTPSGRLQPVNLVHVEMPKAVFDHALEIGRA